MAQWRGAKLGHQAIIAQVQASMKAAASKAVQAGSTALPQALPIPADPLEPQLLHYYTNDATYEKLSELCRGNPYGVLASGDEMSGFLSNLSREEMRPARSFFLTGHNGTSGYKSDRIMRGTVTLSRFAISVLGNIQPDPLCQYLMRSSDEGQQNDGLAQRMNLLVWPDAQTLTYVDKPPTPGAAENLHAVFDAFAELDPQLAGGENAGGWEWFLRLEAAAQTRFVDWLQAENFPARADHENTTALRAHLGKYPKLVLGLALILHLTDLVQPLQGTPPRGSPRSHCKARTCPAGGYRACHRNRAVRRTACASCLQCWCRSGLYNGSPIGEANCRRRHRWHHTSAPHPPARLGRA